jgi:hypothetical protein
MDRTIEVTLDPATVARALRDLTAYQREVETRTRKFQQKMAELIAELSQRGYNTATGNVIVPQGKTPSAGTGLSSPAPKITASCTHESAYSIVIAQGEEVCFVEFGTGVFFNGAAGSSPHPKGVELGLTIGSYGKGNGKKNVWGYYSDTGELILTRGMRAHPALYSATLYVANRVSQIAAEVFR